MLRTHYGEVLNCLNDVSSQCQQKFDSTMVVDEETMKKIEESFLTLKTAENCHSLLKKYLTEDVLNKLKNKKTKLGATLLDVIQSGKSLMVIGLVSVDLFLLTNGFFRKVSDLIK